MEQAVRANANGLRQGLICILMFIVCRDIVSQKAAKIDKFLGNHKQSIVYDYIKFVINSQFWHISLSLCLL